MSYAAFGGFAGHTYGNGIARAYSYNSLLQPSEMKDTGGGYTLLDNVLNWTGGSNNGNLPSQTVKQNGPNFSGGQIPFSPSYNYDTLNRLTSATETSNGTATWSQSFGYDQYGNMWLTASSNSLPTQSLMPNSQSAYSTANNNRLATPTYDAAGNQETYSTYTLTYDAENRQTKASDSSSGETYTYSYDGLGERTSKTAQGVTTSYVHDAFGNLAAEYTSNAPVDQPCTTCYLSWDHLGSTRLVTDSGGIVVARHDFLPFGQELTGGFGGRNDFWGQTDQVTAKFTSQEHDVETALDFFQARYHANQQGRFLSVDPGQAGADPGNPQSWNGYGYVLNSPMMNVDPSGMDGEGGGGEPTTFTVTGTACSWWQFWCWSGSLGGSSGVNAGDGEGAESGAGAGNPYPTGLTFFALGLAQQTVATQSAPVASQLTAPPKSGPGSCVGGGGAGLGAGYNLDLGLGPLGLSSTAGVGAGGFHNRGGGMTSGYSAGGFASGGAAAFAGSHVAGAPAQLSNEVFALGAYGGAGANVFLTNAASVQQLGGPFTTVSVNVGFEVANIGFQYSFGGGVWSLSITPPLASVGFGAAASVIRTNTAATRTGCNGG